MADFDPFASERRKPEGVIMDPHDPNNPTFATEPAVLGAFSGFGSSNVNRFATRTTGGSIAAGMPGDRTQSSRTDFSSNIPRETLDSGNMFNPPDMWSRGSSPTFATSSTSRTGTKSRDSGGIAISLSGALPGNGMEDINSTFNDQTMYNNNDNSLHFNASDETGYNNSLQFNASALHLYVHDANVSASLNDTPYTNILQRVSSLAENPFPSGLNSMLGGFNESQFSTLHFTTNESRNNHSDTNEQIGLTESFALPSSSIDASFSDRTQSIHGTTFGSSNTLTDVLNFRESLQDNVTNMHNVTNDISLNNMANATEENAAALSVGDFRIINNSNQSIEFPPENLTTEIDSFTAENISIETFSHDNSNATAIDLTREMQNTFPSFNAPGLGSGHVERSFIVPIKRKVSVETDAALPNENKLSNTLTTQSEKTLTLQQLYDRSHGGLQSRADLNNVGASNTALGGTLTAEHSGPSNPTSVNAWYTDNVQAGNTKVVGSPITQDKPLQGTSGKVLLLLVFVGKHSPNTWTINQASAVYFATWLGPL